MTFYTCKFIRCFFFCYILAFIIKPSLRLFQDYFLQYLICFLHNCSFTLFPFIIHSTLMRTGYLEETLSDLVTAALRHLRHPFRRITFFLAFTFSLFLHHIYVFLILLLPKNDQNQCLLVCMLQHTANSTCQKSINMWPISLHESLPGVHHQFTLWIFLCLNTVLSTNVLQDWVAQLILSPLLLVTSWGLFFLIAGQ